jgi:hypothetical protein
MLKISEEVDFYTFEGEHLMSIGNDSFFLPVANAIRTFVKKEEGD